MTLTQHIAKHFREVHFGGNWTCSNLKDNLSDVTWKEATTKFENFNTIATLVFHVNYFVSAVLKVLQGNELNANDKFSFDVPDIQSEKEWNELVNKCLNDAEAFAVLVEKLQDEKMWEVFTDEKYGIYYRNLHGIIEHTHYHLGQIAIMKKLIRTK